MTRSPKIMSIGSNRWQHLCWSYIVCMQEKWLRPRFWFDPTKNKPHIWWNTTVPRNERTRNTSLKCLNFRWTKIFQTWNLLPSLGVRPWKWCPLRVRLGSWHLGQPFHWLWPPGGCCFHHRWTSLGRCLGSPSTRVQGLGPSPCTLLAILRIKNVSSRENKTLEGTSR